MLIDNVWGLGAYVVVTVTIAMLIANVPRGSGVCSCYGDDCDVDRYAVALCSCYGDVCDVD
jgi:hypothetical protein